MCSLIARHFTGVELEYWAQIAFEAFFDHSSFQCDNVNSFVVEWRFPAERCSFALMATLNWFKDFLTKV